MADLRTNQRDPIAKLKLLGGVIRLGTFTARELARHADVKGETARAFAEDRVKEGIFQKVGVRRPTEGNRRSGRPENIYQVMPDHRLSILAHIVEVRRGLEITDSSKTYQEADIDEDYTPITLLEADLSALAAGEFEHMDEQLDRLEQARIRLASAEADFRRLVLGRQSFSAIEVLAARLSRARATLRAQEIREDASPPQRSTALQVVTTGAPVTGVVSGHLTPESNDFLGGQGVVRFLLDWSATAEGALKALSPLPPRILDVLDEQRAEQLVRTTLRPSTQLMQAVGDWSPAKRVEFGRELLSHLTTATTADIDSVPRLAIFAAVVEAQDAVEPLMVTLLRDGMIASMPPLGRRLSLLALARLGRPAKQQFEMRTANICHYFMNRTDDELSQPILAPAALQLRQVSFGRVINELASILYDRDGMQERWHAQIDEGAMMRNLAWVMLTDQCRGLRQHIPELLARDYGHAMLKALTSHAHGALRLTDRDDDIAYVVSAGRILAEQAGLFEEEIPLAFPHKVNLRLREFLTRSDDTGGPLTGPLSDPNRPVLRVVNGGHP
jgi:hypothetical protein